MKSRKEVHLLERVEAKPHYGKLNHWETALFYDDPVEYPIVIAGGYARARLEGAQVPVLLAKGDILGIELLNGGCSKSWIESKGADLRRDDTINQGQIVESWVKTLSRSLEILSIRSSRARIARFLLHFTPENKGLEHITHQDIQMFTDTWRENVSDAMSAMRKDGVIDYGRFWIEVKDRDRLEEVAYARK